MKYNVAIRLTTGYSWDEEKGEYDTNSPITKTVNFEGIDANTEKEAIKIAMDKEQSGYSIYDIYTY